MNFKKPYYFRFILIMLSFLALVFIFTIRPWKEDLDFLHVQDTNPDAYFRIKGHFYALSDNYLVVEDLGEVLKIVDLKTKTIIKTLSIPNKVIAGFDIYENTIVWSDFRNEKDSSKIKDYYETPNADIFTYDIKTDKLTQITTNPAPQLRPRIWKNYIVWEDNRNDKVIDIYPEFDIYLYNMDTKEEKLISTVPGVHTNPTINNYKVVWEDGRDVKGDPSIRWGGNLSKNDTDIYMYDINICKEKAIAAGKLRECSPEIYGDYIVWEDYNSNSPYGDIYVFNLAKNKKTAITKDRYKQGDPKIFDHYIVWMDERRGTSSNDVIIDGKAPNSDIFLYDLKTNKEKRLTGDGPQMMPEISSEWAAYEISRQINPEIEVIKYK